MIDGERLELKEILVLDAERDLKGLESLEATT